MQFGERLADLDELLLRCRAHESKAFLAEVVACYRAGAYRSAVISTWIAVVFDLIGKFKEVALTGDAAALRFERNILQQAREQFQLISFIEEEYAAETIVFNGLFSERMSQVASTGLRQESRWHQNVIIKSTLSYI